MLRLNEGLRCHHERADKITQGSLRQYHQMTASVSWHPLHHLSRNTTYDTARGKKLAREREKKIWPLIAREHKARPSMVL